MDENRDLYHQALAYNAASVPMQCVMSPWYIRVSKHCLYWPQHKCQIEPLNCGKSVFSRIRSDISMAEKTVDIITWGFDPGMVLVPSGSMRQGTRYGDLLKQVASRNEAVIVRLLLWHDDFMSYATMKNNPGLYGAGLLAVGTAGGYFGEEHARYNVEWFDEITAGKFPNIRLHLRHVPLEYRKSSLDGEIYDAGLKGKIASIYASHHQKMILIDYENPSSALGYVMGHNSTTDFWDSAEHIFRDPRRETLFKRDPEEISRGNAFDQAQDFINTHSYAGAPARMPTHEARVRDFYKNQAFTAKPYQDVSLRVRGPILSDLNHNFCEGWSASVPAKATALKLALRVTESVSSTNLMANSPHTLLRAFQAAVHKDIDPNFITRRKKLKAEAFELKKGLHSAQLIRTQPMKAEKAIKECYANLTRLAQHYIFIQNQYVQYVEWAEQLKACMKELRSAGYKKEIYVFLLTSTPESTGMDLPTYDIARSLGQSNTMVFEHADALEAAQMPWGQSVLTFADLTDLGIHVLMGSLWTCASDPKAAADYEEIYIHSKVMIVDDAAFTLGSANLNVRSMALDSELNILSEAKEVAYELRKTLFCQSTGNEGPSQFGDMQITFMKWRKAASTNSANKNSLRPLVGQLLPFCVDRMPTAAVM